MRDVAAWGLAAVTMTAASAQSWVVRDAHSNPPALVTYDSHRSRGVMLHNVFLGNGSSTAVLVSEWDGIRWTPRPATGPGPTYVSGNGALVHSFTFDPIRRQSILLCGFNGAPEAWAWDGTSWTALPAMPFPFLRHGAAFDLATASLLVFADEGKLTWRFNGTTWSQLTFTGLDVGLQAGWFKTMAYDRVRGRTVMIGGNGTDVTYEWNGTAWTGGAPVGPLGIDPGQVAAIYDPQRGKVILPNLNGTSWEWNGSNWLPFATPAAPLGQSFFSRLFFYDEQRQHLAMYVRSTNSTWTQDPAAWVRRQRTVLSYATLFSADHPRGDVLAVEPEPSPFAAPLSTTLRRTASGWQELGNLGLPGREGAAQSDRDLLGVIYRFGGNTGAPNFTETNELRAFNGTAWSLVAAPNAPTPRAYSALAVDPIRQRLVSFGGGSQGGGGTLLNDTHEFDGTQWVQRSLTNAPSPRTFAAMCGSATLGRVFLFGGASASVIFPSLTDFWSYDGTNWTQLPQPPLGAPILGASLADFPAAGSIVLAVLTTGTGQPDTWSWNGTAWSALADAPVGHQGRALVAEPGLGSVYAPGSGALLTTNPSIAIPFGSGCASSLGAPSLRPFGRPWLGNASFAFDLTTALPGLTAGLVAFGSQPAVIPLPGGCTAWFAPEATQLVLANNGFGSVSLPVPPQPSLLGAQLLAQGVVLDAAVAQGFALSAAIGIVVGD
ncbi:MAG: hypothetical protein MUC36_27415 [Planctomycetes bacterium]|jgi:hypothetical protein|nr:hypothetical protein [Planctomycetota bacterium]